MSGANKENKDKAIEVMKNLAKGKAKGLLKDKIKKNETAREAVDEVKKSPSLKAVGALSLMLAKRAALKAKKRFKTGKNSELELEGSYDPRTKEKKIQLNWKKDF